MPNVSQVPTGMGRPNLAENWLFWPNIGIFGPFRNGQIWSKICIFGHFGPNIGIFVPFRPMPAGT